MGKHHYEPRQCISSIAGGKNRTAIYGGWMWMIGARNIPALLDGEEWIEVG